MATWEEHTSQTTRTLRSTNGTTLFIDYESQFCGDTKFKGRMVKWRAHCRLSQPAKVVARILLDGEEIPKATTTAESFAHSDHHFMIYTETPVPEGVTIDRVDFVFTVEE